MLYYCIIKYIVYISVIFDIYNTLIGHLSPSKRGHFPAKSQFVAQPSIFGRRPTVVAVSADFSLHRLLLNRPSAASSESPLARLLSHSDISSAARVGVVYGQLSLPCRCSCPITVVCRQCHYHSVIALTRCRVFFDKLI